MQEELPYEKITQIPMASCLCTGFPIKYQSSLSLLFLTIWIGLCWLVFEIITIDAICCFFLIDGNHLGSCGWMPFIISIMKSWSPIEGVLSMIMPLYCLENSKRKGQFGCTLPNMLCSCDHLHCSLVASTINLKISKPLNNFTQTSFEWTRFTMSLHMDEISIYKAS